MPLLSIVLGGRTGRSLGVLAAAVVCGGLAATLRGGETGADEACVGVDGASCETAGLSPAEAMQAAGPVVLDRATACRDAAYLCEGLAERGTLRVLRWDASTREIRVLVPLPPGEDAAMARRLQQAAALGIRAWDGHPFPIRVELRETGSREPHITVRWAERLGSTELGVASTRWGRHEGRLGMVVQDFALVTRSPYDPSTVLPVRQVELTAAHEMGHALGLPHSDAEHDVMHPTNTASALSARDYRAMETLYELENGAEIR